DPTVAFGPDGAVYFGFVAFGPADGAVAVSRSLDGGRTWGTVTVVADDGRNTSRNPVPIVDRRTGRIVLVSCWDLAAVDEHRVMAGSAPPSRVHVQHSDDGGLSWSRPRDITEQVRMPGWRWYATGPGAVEQLAGGRMLVPANHSDPAGRGPRHRSHVLYSDDGGETWALGGQVDAPGSNEAQLAQRPDGAVVLYMRNQAEGRKQLAVSRDDGLSWEPARRIPELVGTACQGDLIAVGNLLLATSHQHHRLRRDLALNVSADGGETWPAYSVVAAGRAGYSDLVALPSGRVGILMERDDDRIDYAELRPAR
ncbi:MAG TPA: sialidase family protein, partial [Pseudolysinimonas sp.]|nr:sialidase family protein [Pseudolysinimonas sp.]